MGSVRFSDFPANGPFSENFCPQGDKSKFQTILYRGKLQLQQKIVTNTRKWQVEWEMDNFGQKGGIFELR